MAIPAIKTGCGNKSWCDIARILAVIVLVIGILSLGSWSCKKAEEVAEEGEVLQEETLQAGVTIEEGTINFKGTVKLAMGKYLYIPEVPGFDVVIEGDLDSGDLASLEEKQVQGQGQFLPEMPSILVADSLEIMDENEEWTPAFTRTADPAMDEFLNLTQRNEFPVLKELAYDKKDGWEGKEKGKVYGKLEQDGEALKIAIIEGNKEVGKINVGDMTSFSHYYLKKLRFFNEFWFYLNIKDTVEWRQRRRSREMFNADVLFVGLF